MDIESASSTPKPPGPGQGRAEEGETARDEDLPAAAEDAAELLNQYDLALKAYDGALNDRDAQAVNKARAELAVARAADSAQDHLSSLEVGTIPGWSACRPGTAQAAVEQAKAGQAQRLPEFAGIAVGPRGAQAPIGGTVMNLAVRQRTDRRRRAFGGWHWTCGGGLPAGRPLRQVQLGDSVARILFQKP